MKVPFKARNISTWVVIPSAIVVAALALLEYRWSTSVSEATAVRLADSLQMSMMNWQKDFFRYFSEIGLALRIDPIEDVPGDAGQYARRFAEWQAVARYPKLVSNVYLLNPDRSAEAPALRLDAAGMHFAPQNWPPRFEPLRGDLERAAAEFLHGRRTRGASPANLRELYAFFDPDAPSAGWRFEPGIPALVHPIVLAKEPAGKQSVGWIVVELSQREIETRILSDLSRTYFQGTDGLDYLVAVVSGNAPGHVMYSSDTGFGYPLPTDADGAIDLFGRAPANSRGLAVHVFHAPSNDKGPDASVGIPWFPLLRQIPEELDWRLVVRHRRGGALGAFVVEMRRRDLAIGFGVLLVLAINMAMLIVTSHRAQRLAQLQMDFVTAVSHELRTPLSVIMSGADNLSSGVVENRQQMLQYGSVIGNQARQLFGLVERILLFAATRQVRLRYNLRPLDVQETIDRTLESTAGLIEASQFHVECHIEEGLPPVMGDAAALSQCLQNLIVNALKYGGEQHWLGIGAAAGKQNPAEVRISVSDRGPGIGAKDLAHIFEPFYRSPSVRAAQIHGTGLGLPLSKSIAEAMNGRLSVITHPGRGSTFTLHLRCAEQTRKANERLVKAETN